MKRFIAGAAAALMLVIALMFAVLGGREDGQDQGGVFDGVAEVVDQILHPRIQEVRLVSEVLVEAIEGWPEQYLVAWTVKGQISAVHPTLHQTSIPLLGEIALGVTEVSVRCPYQVDLGIDLQGAEFYAECNADETTCVLVVPDPTYRPPALDVSRLQVASDGAWLVWGDREDQAERDAIAMLRGDVEEEIRESRFWNMHRENLRVSLADFAQQRLAGNLLGHEIDEDDARGTPPHLPTITIEFAHERHEETTEGALARFRLQPAKGAP